MIRITEPTIARIDGGKETVTLLKRYLSYTDKSASYQYQKFLKGSGWFTRKYGKDEYLRQARELKEKVKNDLLFHDDDGYWTYSGLARQIQQILLTEIKNEVDYPEPSPVPWDTPPPFEPRSYQSEAVEALLKAKHGAIELMTGGGKSFILMLLVKRLGLKTVIMAPSKSIALQLHEQFSKHLGKKRVGLYGNGKKQSDKQFVIAIDKSLSRTDPNSEHWKRLSSAQVFCADESHMTPAKTLTDVCFNLMKDAPYRFFVSGTQIRNDGKEKLLQAIIGDIVYEMDVAQGIRDGYLSPIRFCMVNVRSPSKYKTEDVNRLNRVHLYNNTDISQIAAQIANESVDRGRHVLIMVEEVFQFMVLLPYLKREAWFAHGAVQKDRYSSLPEKYQKSNNHQLVADFNEGRFPILVGTKAIGIGTDVKNADHIIYLQGKSSEVKIRQVIGRGTRRVPGKKNCIFTDFDITNVELLHDHANRRRAYYNSICPPIIEIRDGAK